MSYIDREDYQELELGDRRGLTWLEWVGAAAIATIAMAGLMAFAFLVG